MICQVKDSEIKVPRVLTAEQRRAKEEAERVEAERRALAALDNAHERGIEDMMYSRLEGKDENDVWQDVPRPAFMAQTPAAQWDEDQKRAAQVYEQAVKELNELRDKRRKALDGQLRKLERKVRTVCDNFDQRLQQLLERRIAVEQAVTREELALLKIAKVRSTDWWLAVESGYTSSETGAHRGKTVKGFSLDRLFDSLAHAPLLLLF